MSIPANFCKALTGLCGSSDKLVKTEQQYKGARGYAFLPCHSRQYFIRIDDPRAIDSDGLRESDANNASMDLIKESWLPRRYADGTLTYGGKGAWLECRDVVIPKDKRLWFRYAFLRFSSLPLDVMAALLLFPNNDTNATPLPPYWICSVKDLQENMDNVNQTGWTECFAGVDRDKDFRGTLRWVVTTGHNVTGHNVAGQSSTADNTRFAGPGCLLIDDIDIR